MKSLIITSIFLTLTLTNFAQTPPAPIYSGPLSVCAGALIELDTPNVDLSNEFSIYWFKWYSDSCGVGQESFGIPPLGQMNYTSTVPGVWTIWVKLFYYNADSTQTSGSGMYISDSCLMLTVTLLDLPKPEPDLGQDIYADSGSIHTLNPGTFESYKWYGTGNQNPPTDPTIDVLLDSDSSEWDVIVTDNNGCVGYDTIWGYFQIADTTIIDTTDSTSSIRQVIGTNSTFNLYPNPATNKLYIKSNHPIHSVIVYNALGEAVISSNRKEIDIQQLIYGQYVIVVDGQPQVFLKQ